MASPTAGNVSSVLFVDLSTDFLLNWDNQLGLHQLRTIASWQNEVNRISSLFHGSILSVAFA